MSNTKYDPSKYLVDPRFPDLVCPVCDYEAETLEEFRSHSETHSFNELTDAIYLIQGHNWRMEQIIRNLTGKQSIEIDVSGAPTQEV